MQYQYSPKRDHKEWFKSHDGKGALLASKGLLEHSLPELK